MIVVYSVVEYAKRVRNAIIRWWLHDKLHNYFEPHKCNAFLPGCDEGARHWNDFEEAMYKFCVARGWEK